MLSLVAALSSCGGDGPGQPSALGGETGQMTLCTPVAGSGPVVAADEFLRNESTRSLTLDDVRLVDPRGLTLVGVSLVPVQDQTLLGTSAFPPRSPVWAARREGIGAELAPGETSNLALTLDRDGARGSFADVEVAFTADGHSSTYRLRYALTVVAAPACGSADAQVSSSVDRPDEGRPGRPYAG